MYNKLLDTKFENNIWKFNNCYYKDGYLISTGKVFGIEQEITLYELDKLYLRFNFNVENYAVKRAIIGFQVGNILYSEYKNIKNKSWQTISVVREPEDYKVKVHIIFESENITNKVYIKNPLLVNLEELNKAHWLKISLDKSIYYRHGYSYSNDYKDSEVLIDSEDFKDYNLEKAKHGSIIKTKENLNIKIDTKNLNLRKYYLVKLSLEEINDLGKTYFKYGSIISKSINNQIYLIFKKSDKIDLYLNIETNNVLDYMVNVKDIMIVELTKLNIIEDDVVHLVYI